MENHPSQVSEPRRGQLPYLFLTRMTELICVSCVALSLFVPPLPAQENAASLYKTKCALCHAPDGSGSGPVGKQLNVPSLRSREVQAQTNDEWIQVTENGKGKMPAYKGRLSDDQIRQLIIYIRELVARK